MIIRVPAEIRLTDIAGFPLNFGTSYYALAHRAKLAQGETLAVALSVIGAPYGGFTRRNPAGWGEMMSTLLESVRSGALKPLIHRRYTFEQAREALGMVQDRKVVGKCILLSDRGLAGG